MIVKDNHRYNSLPPFRFTKDIKDRWIKALRSGRYPKTVGVLIEREHKKNTINRHCCLGVLERILSYPSQSQTKLLYNGRYPIGLSRNFQNTLISLNDEKQKSFKEIADYIEKNIKPVKDI